MKTTINIAVFASGAGSNARKLIEHFGTTNGYKGKNAVVALVVGNKKNIGVWSIAEEYKLPTLLIEKETFFNGSAYLNVLQQHKIDFIVLAGFLWKVPSKLIEAYSGKIVNIHPALLPKYGGKGMYGAHVHEAVIAAGEKESGITIHVVDEHYDHGKHLLQATCPVLTDDTPDTLAARIHQLEHAHYAQAVEKAIEEL